METVKKLWNAISTALVAVMVVAAVALVGVRLVGLNVFYVLSGSMEPVYSPGDLIYVKDVDPMTLTDGWHTAAAGEPFFYISNPALGLWADKARF